MVRIAVVGGGLCGRFVSLLLSQLGASHCVTLFDNKPLNAPQSTGRIAAAMVAPLAESVTTSERITKMGFWSVEAWPKLLSHLALKTPFHQSGSIVVAHRQDEADYQQFLARIKRCMESAPEHLNKPLLEMLEPELAQSFNRGLFLPKEGHIDNGLLYQELEQKISDSDIKLFTEEDVSPTQINHLFDHLIDCRGMGAKAEIANSETRLRGVRGEVIRVYAPEVHLTRPVRLMHPRYPLYIVPKSDNCYVIGATQIESEHGGAVTVRSALELLSAAYSLHPGFAEAEIKSADASLRPTLQHNEPEVYVQDKLIQINGLFRHGFMIIPYVLQQVLNVLKISSPLSRQNCNLDKTLVRFHENSN